MKKRSIILATVIMTMGLLAGCGNSEGNNETVSTDSTGTTSVETIEESATPEVANVYLKDINPEDYMTMSSDYKGLALTVAPREEVTQEQIEALGLQAYNNTISAESGGVLDRAAQEGDTVNIDFVGTIDGVAFDGGTASGQSLTLGSGAFIDGFEDGLIGATPGQTLDVNVVFPDPYTPNTDMSGVAAVFSVTVNFIHPNSVSEMKDEVISAATNGEYTTVEAFLEYCKEYLEYNADYNYDTNKQTAVLQAVDAIAVFTELPEDLVNYYSSNVMNSLTTQAAGYGVDADTFCNYYFGVDSGTYVRSAAESSTRQAIIFQYIANQENLILTDEEFQTTLQEYVEENHLSSVEELLESGDEEQYREYFMFEKVVDFVFDNAVVSES